MSAIEVKLFAAGSNTPFVLGNLADPREHGIEGITGDESREVEVAQFLRAASVKVFARGNRRESLTLRVARLHANLGASLQHWLRHPLEVPVKADLRFRQDTAVCWLNGGGIQQVRRVERHGGGLTTVFEYAVIGGTWGNQRMS